MDIKYHTQVPLSIKQQAQLKSYHNWKISKSSIGRNPNLLKHYLNLVDKKKNIESNG